VTSPSNGFVGTTGTTFGATAIYSCQTGYVLSGTATRTCQADGTWSGTTPACTQIDCYQPAGILNGWVNATYTIWGSIASYTCNSGYSMTGAFTRTCQSDGTWSGTPPICTLVDCGTAPSISNGTLLNAYATAYNSAATYSCNTGYYFSGFATTRTCQADGTWSLPSPVCSIQMLKLTFSKVGHGTGTVTSSDGSVSCGSTCAGAVANYAYGTNIYLSAVADVSFNQSFMGWNGAGCAGFGGCQFTITVDTTVTANFSPPPNIMFVTSTKSPPAFGGLYGADTICRNLAAAAQPKALPGNYVAWLSSTSVSALSRLNGATGWVRPDGRPVFNSVDDLSQGKVFYPPRLDESGNDVGANQWVMTNTLANGTPYSVYGAPWSTCQDFSSNIEDGTALEGGLSSFSSNNFTNYYGLGCSGPGRLYCLGTDRQAQVAVIPAQGRHAFVTRSGWTPGGGIASADALCQKEANLAQLSGTYLALLPTTGSYAAARFSTTGLPWIRSDGSLIAQTASTFFSPGLFDVAPNMSADGSYYFGSEAVWSGAASPLTSATDAENCTSWTSTIGSGTSGQAGDTAKNGFFSAYPSGPNSIQCSGGASLLCLQQ
jgi:hypothetical protein